MLESIHEHESQTDAERAFARVRGVLERIHTDIVEAGSEKASCVAQHTMKERLRKQIRAEHIVRFINDGSTVGKSEHMALLEPDYIRACEEAESAEKAAGVAAAEYEAVRAKFAAWQTMQATEREKMKIEQHL